jgi:hypothetical protein
LIIAKIKSKRLKRKIIKKINKKIKKKRHRMKHKALILILSIFLLFLFINITNIKAYDDNGTYFTCYNCSDCMAALNDNTYNEVRLGADITNQAGTCINNPENFSNKTFDCQGHVTDGIDTYHDAGILIAGYQKNNITIKNCGIVVLVLIMYLLEL